MSSTPRTLVALREAERGKSRTSSRPRLTKWVGIVPAAGEGRRLNLGGYPKELIPVHYRRTKGTHFRPVLAIESTVSAMADAGVDTVCVIVSESKLEILRVLGDGSAYGCNVIYTIQPRCLGLWDAVERGLSSFVEKDILLALPDTLFQPEDALSQLKANMESTRADLSLGVFPTSSPETQAPVLHVDQMVKGIWEKPSPAPVQNTWGIAAWSTSFTKRLPEFRRNVSTAQPSITLAFIEAMRSGLKLNALPFNGGRYVDLGTPEGLAESFDPDSGSPRCIEA